MKRRIAGETMERVDGPYRVVALIQRDQPDVGAQTITEQVFGVFDDLASAEQCVMNLAARPNVINAEIWQTEED